MNNDKNHGYLCIQPCCPDRMPSLFSKFIDAIGFCKTVFIFKNKCSQFECDTMFPLVKLVLLLVPFVAQLYIQMYHEFGASLSPLDVDNRSE